MGARLRMAGATSSSIEAERLSIVAGSPKTEAGPAKTEANDGDQASNNRSRASRPPRVETKRPAIEPGQEDDGYGVPFCCIMAARIREYSLAANSRIWSD